MAVALGGWCVQLAIIMPKLLVYRLDPHCVQRLEVLWRRRALSADSSSGRPTCISHCIIMNNSHTINNRTCYAGCIKGVILKGEILTDRESH